jgi:outer membrane protein OmpU
MKKILLTTTALVATTGFAMADVTLSGSADMGFKHNDSGVNKTTVESDVDINANASGETDGGISWTANAGFGNDTNSANSGASTGTADNGKVTISGDFGTISVGAVAEAESGVGIADVGYDGIGIDNVAESSRAFTTHDVSWGYSMDGISLDVSTNTHTDAVSMAAGWTSGALTIKVAHSDVDGGASSTSGSVSTSVGGLSVSAMAASHSTAATGDSSGVAISMPMDGLGTVTFVMADNDSDTDASYGVGFSKSLGGGATLAGGYGSADNVGVADLGISFSF